MAKVDPPWLPQARKLCRDRGINIAGWGSRSLVVHAESPDRVRQIACELAVLGLQPVLQEDDSIAGLLTLSQDPAPVREPQRPHRPVDLSVRPLMERLRPILQLAICVTCLALAIRQPISRSWSLPALAIVFFGLFLLDSARIWGWRLQISPEELRIRRAFRWSTIPWAEIRSVESSYAGRPRQEAVTLRLASDACLRLGTFSYGFARALRDRLRQEIAPKQPVSQPTGSRSQYGN